MPPQGPRVRRRHEQLNRLSAHHDITDTTVHETTLLQYRGTSSDLQVRMRWLAAIADSAASAAGGKLLATLELAAAHGQPVVRYHSPQICEVLRLENSSPIMIP